MGQIGEGLGRLQFLVDQRGFGPDGVEHVVNGGLGLVFDLDEGERLVRRFAGVGGDGGHAFAHVADPLHGQYGLIPEGRPVKGRDSLDLENVRARQHGFGPGRLSRFRRVDPGQKGVGVRAPKDRRMKHAGQREIRHVPGVSGDLGHPVDAGNGFSDNGCGHERQNLLIRGESC